MGLFDELLRDKRIVVTLGAGGVGKTTTSIALAVLAAQNGKRVGLLSIDPAKRLASALGLELGSDLRRLNLGPEILGSVDAAMLDQKAVFDEMVIRFAKSPQNRDRILNHTLYKAASTKFGGALEYMALGKLEKMAESNAYDLIVLDTPPDAHALDFLVRPNILAGFMENKVMQWLIKPINMAQKFGLTKILTMGERLAGGIAEVTGVRALQILAEFLVLMQDVIEGFHRSGERVMHLLRSESTGFVLVTSLRSSAVRSAIHLARQLKQMEHQIDRLIINRGLPPDIAESIATLPSHITKLGPAKPWLQSAFNSYRVSQKLGEKIESALKLIFSREVPVQRIPEQTEDIHSVTAILRFAQNIGQG